MKQSSYKRILYFIGAVIFITLSIQIYWNYQNYQAGKQQLINEVQISLDNAVDQYYASGAQRRTLVSLPKFQTPKVTRIETDQVLSAYRIPDDSIKILKGTRFLPAGSIGNINPGDIDRIEVLASKGSEELASQVGKILISMKKDTLDMSKLDSLVQKELQRKKIGVDYSLVYLRPGQPEQSVNPEIIREDALQTLSKSAWLPQNSELSLYFSNETGTILKSNMIGLLLSTILMVAVIGCLLFLLRIINDQKQLAEMKNDLISNITHEFKTPISTIRVAMEGILNFNSGNDPEKAKNYARTSTAQVEKLNHMVEKLLETATLTGNQLQLEKEVICLAPVLESLVQKYSALATHKSIKFEAAREDIRIWADPFHLENAFSNIIDNAVKYGGDEISVLLSSDSGKVIVHFIDSGNSLTKIEASRIFDKFYRVPKGNTHDVKGFGIGLYYTKQIIERHCGNIKVEVKKNTNIIVELPHE